MTSENILGIFILLLSFIQQIINLLLTLIIDRLINKLKMYDLDREPVVALGGFINQSLCFHLPSTHRIEMLQNKSSHYDDERKIQIVEMLENIFKQLFYYSKSLQKINSTQQQINVLDILLDNIKNIVVFNADKYGIIPEQRTFCLIISYLHSKLHKQNNLRQFLNQVHWLLIVTVSNYEQELPFAFTALLNGQFQELLEYVKSKFSPYVSVQNLESLIDLLIYKIQSQENYPIDPNSKTKIYEKLKKQISSNDRFKNLIKILKETSKKNLSTSALFQGDYELELIISIMAGNYQIIQLISKGSWAIYLNLYINFIQPMKNSISNNNTYENIIDDFMKKNNQNISKNQQLHLNQQERFLINLIDSCNMTRTHSFHEIYQNSFNIFSPVLCHLIGMLMLETKVVDLFSIFNNKDYYEQICLSLLQSASDLSWSSLVYMIGFLEHNQFFKQASHMISLWQSLLFKYLPYDLSFKPRSEIKSQIKEIQQKIQDLNMIGLKYITKSYLNANFKLQLNSKNSLQKLNEIILELFFLNLQIPDNNNANQCMHEMKIFMKNYLKNFEFDYKMIDYLEYLFDKKQNILDKKTISKIHSLFKLIYKIGQIYSETSIVVEGYQTQQVMLLKQLKKFNNLFQHDSHKSISLCVELLKLAKYLLQKINESSLQVQMQMQIQTQQTQQQNQVTQIYNADKIIKAFKRNLMDYLKEWKYNIQENYYGKDAQQLLKYFHKHLY